VSNLPIGTWHITVIEQSPSFPAKNWFSYTSTGCTTITQATSQGTAISTAYIIITTTSTTNSAFLTNHLTLADIIQYALVRATQYYP